MRISLFLRSPSLQVSLVPFSSCFLFLLLFFLYAKANLLLYLYLICWFPFDLHWKFASERARQTERGGWGGKGEDGAHVHVTDFHTLIYTLTHTHFYKLTFSKLRLHLLWIKIWFCLYFCLCYCLFFLPLPLNFAHRKNIDCTHTHTRTHFL